MCNNYSTKPTHLSSNYLCVTFHVPLLFCYSSCVNLINCYSDLCFYVINVTNSMWLHPKRVLAYIIHDINQESILQGKITQILLKICDFFNENDFFWPFDPYYDVISGQKHVSLKTVCRCSVFINIAYKFYPLIYPNCKKHVRIFRNIDKFDLSMTLRGYDPTR